MLELLDRVQPRFVACDLSTERVKAVLQLFQALRVGLRLRIQSGYRGCSIVELAFELRKLSFVVAETGTRPPGSILRGPPLVAQPSELVEETRQLPFGARDRCTPLRLVGHLLCRCRLEGAKSVKPRIELRTHFRE
ncbi:MAG: hypothetical protein ACREJX_03635, partial [Polyangiaceae bacterium]